jgi:hypothetical protein
MKMCCPVLSDLDLGECPNLEDKALYTLLSMPKLQILNLADCPGLKFRFEGYVGEIHYWSVTNNFFRMESLPVNPNIQSLCLRSCPGVDDLSMGLLLPCMFPTQLPKSSSGWFFDFSSFSNFSF